MRSIGIDIGKKKCVVCVMDAKGNVLEETEYENTIHGATRFAERMRTKYRGKGRIHAACESTGTMWHKTFNAFEAVGISIYLANTFKMKIISDTGDAKTDKIDAYKIADTLRLQKVPKCHVPSSHTRGVRQMIRYQIRKVRERTATVNFTRDCLERYDYTIKGSLYLKKNLEKMSEIKLDGAEDVVFQGCVAKIRTDTEEIEKLRRKIEATVAASEDARLIKSMTGMDAFIGLLLAAEIDGIGRFASPDKLVSWAGMCPTVHQSGDSLYHGRIKKFNVNRLVKWAVVQAAWAAANSNDTRLSAYYENVKRRHGGNSQIAITHLANKMLRIVWAMLTTRTPYSTRLANRYDLKIARVERAASEYGLN